MVVSNWFAGHELRNRTLPPSSSPSWRRCSARSTGPPVSSRQWLRRLVEPGGGGCCRAAGVLQVGEGNDRARCRTYAVGGAGLHETDRPGDTVAIGERERAHAAPCGPGHQVPAVRRTVADGMPGGGVQMSKSIASHLPSLAHPLPGLHLLTYPPHPRTSTPARNTCSVGVRCGCRTRTFRSRKPSRPQPRGGPPALIAAPYLHSRGSRAST